MTLNGKHLKTTGEKVSTWAKAIGVLVATGLATYGAFNSSEAKDDVDDNLVKLSEQVNKQNKVINAQSEKLEKLARRMIYFQAQAAGINTGKLYQQNVELQKRLDDIRAAKIARASSVGALRKLLEERRGKTHHKPSPKPAAKSDGQHIQKLVPMAPYRNGKKAD